MKNFAKYALLILAPVAIFQPLGMDIFVSTIPEMLDSLKVTPQKIQYLLIVFMIASSIPQLIMGKLADYFGRRPLMLLATFGFCVTSYMCTATENIYWLTFIRFLHGGSAATCLVLVFAIVRDIASEGNSSAKMYSYISCILALTAMLAPLIGASLADIFHTWHATFISLSWFGVFALLIVYLLLPETRKPVVCIDESQLLSFSAFKKVFESRVFWTFVICATTSMTGLYLYFSIGSILLMKKLGVSSYTYSILFGLNASFYLFGNYISSLLLDKLKIVKIVLTGNVLVFIGASLMLISNLSLGLSVLFIVASNSFITLGGGLMVGPATSAALEPFAEYAGTASGIFGAVQYGLPALIGYLVTRYELTIVALAGPIVLLGLLNFIFIANYRSKEMKLTPFPG